MKNAFRLDSTGGVYIAAGYVKNKKIVLLKTHSRRVRIYSTRTGFKRRRNVFRSVFAGVCSQKGHAYYTTSNRSAYIHIHI